MLVMLVVATPSVAAKPITGKLSKPGYQVIALAANGATKSARAKPRFRIRPPARRVALQLRARDGTYAGPIVVGRKRHGRRAIEGVRAGARLGYVRVKRAEGYAKIRRKARKRLAPKWISEELRARARQGVPIGAGKFGHVRSRRTHGGVPGDRDIDGVPNALDVDDDGDLVLDPFDRRLDAAKQEPEAELRTDVGARSRLDLDFDQSTNANAPDSSGARAFTDADIERTFQGSGSLLLGGLDIPADPDTDVELDCGGQPDPDDPDGWTGGLAYCTRGGTGTLSGELNFIPPGAGVGDRYPECCDADGNGMGTLVRRDYGANMRVAGVGLLHGARTDEVSAGDLLLVRFTEDGAPREFSGTLPFVYATVPVLASYSDAASNCAQASGARGDCPTHFSYPIGPDGPGTQGNPFPIVAGPDGHLSVTLTIWPPQRKSLPDEAGRWMDTGRTLYSIHGRPFFSCWYEDYSTADPNLTPVDHGILDRSDDRPAEPTDTLSFTVDFTPCAESAAGDFLERGDKFQLDIDAQPAAPDPAPVHNFARTTVWFKLG
jgi:hypothetical protein